MRRGAPLFLVSLVALSGCRRATDLVPLRVVASPILSNLPLFVAADEHLFEAEGLAVEFLNLRNAEALAATAGGGADVMAQAVTAGLFNAIARGARLRIVADKEHDEPGGCRLHGFVVHSSLLAGGPFEPRDLAGRRVSVAPTGAADYVFHQLLASAGLRISDVTRLPPFDGGERLEAMRSGAVDLIASGEPAITQIESAGLGRLWKGGEDVVGRTQVSALILGPRLLDREPALGRRFVRAYLAGAARLAAGKTPRLLEIAADHTALDAAVLSRACWPHPHTDGHVELDAIDSFQRWALSVGYLDRVVPREEYWDPSFTSRAAAIP